MHDCVGRINANNSRLWPIELTSQLPIGANISDRARRAVVRRDYWYDTPLGAWDGKPNPDREKALATHRGLDMSKSVQRERHSPLSVEDFQERVAARELAAQERERERAHRAALRERKLRREREWEEAAEEREDAYQRDMKERQRRTEQQLAAKAAEIGVPSLTAYEYAVLLRDGYYVVTDPLSRR